MPERSGDSGDSGGSAASGAPMGYTQSAPAATYDVVGSAGTTGRRGSA